MTFKRIDIGKLDRWKGNEGIGCQTEGMRAERKAREINEVDEGYLSIGDNGGGVGKRGYRKEVEGG